MKRIFTLKVIALTALALFTFNINGYADRDDDFLYNEEGTQTFMIDGITYYIQTDPEKLGVRDAGFTVEDHVVAATLPSSGYETITLPQTVEYKGTVYTVIGLIKGHQTPPNVDKYKNDMSGKKVLRKLILPETIKIIYPYQFCDYAPYLEEVYGNGIKQVNGNAFRTMRNLKKVSFPNCTIIYEDGFRDCQKLVTIDMPKVQTIQDDVFYDCLGLEEVDFPECTEIYEVCFRNCVSLKKVNLPKVKETKLNDNSSIFQINFYLHEPIPFYRCNSIEEVNLGSLETLRKGTFAMCKGSATRNISSSWRYITGSSTLSKLELSSVKTVGDYALYKCTDLASLSLPAVETIGNNAFEGCNNLKNLEITHVKSLGDNALKGCSSLTSLYMPELTSIGDNALNGCTSLKYLYMPNVSNIGSGIFNSNSKVRAVMIPNAKGKVGDGAYNGMTSIKSISLPDGINEIGANTFKGNAAMTYFTMPAECTTIGKGAFDGTTSLEWLNIPAYNGGVTKSLAAAMTDRSHTTLFVPVADKDKYTSLGFKDVVTERSTTVKSGQYNVMTWSYPVDLNVGSNSKLSFYLADGYTYDAAKNADYGFIKLRKVSRKNAVLPANTPVLIYYRDWTGEHATRELKWHINNPANVNEGVDESKRILFGTPAAIHFDRYISDDNRNGSLGIGYNLADADADGNYREVTDNDYENFLLTTNADMPAGVFVPTEQGPEDDILEGEQAFLQLRYGSIHDSAGNIRGIKLVVDDSDTPTGIDTIDSDAATDSDKLYYRPDGTATTAPSAGLYIHNGKKVIINNAK